MENKSSVQDLVDEAIQLHKMERTITLKSTLLVARLEDMRASLAYGMSTGDFARLIGLSSDQYWKRAQAARILRAYPETKALLERGETSVSVISMLSARLTEANADILLAGIKNKNKRQVRELLSVVTNDGQIIESEPTVEIKLTFTKSQMEKLDRAVEVLAARGKNPGMNEVLIQAVDDLLWRRDPVLKAERAQKIAGRRARVLLQGAALAQAEISNENLDSPSLPAAPAQAGKRTTIPSSFRHHVWLRDQGQCTWKHPSGERCSERKMLELDHLLMVCRGGENEVNNLTLRCRFHNQIRAETLLGRGFMDQHRAASIV
jgi:hypothetical protein